MKFLALTLPGNVGITPPSDIPSGGNAEANTIIQTGLEVFIFVGIITALFFLIWGGIQWITSGGDKAKVDKARKTLIFSIIGLIVMVLAVAVVSTIGSLLGIQYFSIVGG